MSSVQTVAVLGIVHPLGRAVLRAITAHPQLEVGALVEFGGAESLRSLYLQYPTLLQSLPNSLLETRVHRIEKIREVRESADLVISALDSKAAQLWEPAYAKHGLGVLASSPAHTTDMDVPLIEPLMNPHHLDGVDLQRKARGYQNGFLVGSASLLLRSLLTAIQPLHQEVGVKRAHCTLLCGIEALEPRNATPVISNIVPRTAELAAGLRVQALKCLGFLEPGGIQSESVDLNISVLQIPVAETLWTQATLETESDLPEPEEIRKLFEEQRNVLSELQIASAPKPLLNFHSHADRPQSRLDCQGACGVSLGQVQRIHPRTLQLSVCLNGSADARADSLIQLAGLCLSQGLLAHG